jgi:hypothetical protein
MCMKHCARIGVLIAAIIAIHAVTPARAQVIIGRGGGGVSISVPGLGGVRLGVPYGLSRRVLVAPYGVGPGYPYPGYPYYNGYSYSSGPVPRFAARPIGSIDGNFMQPLPTAGELRAMDDSSLLNALAALTARLDFDLNRFDTGDTWQRYLRLPEDALPPPTDDQRVVLGMNSIVDTLTRFDRTVAKPEYVQISGLPSFAAVHAALAEVVQRFGADGNQSIEVAQTPVASDVPQTSVTLTPPIPRPDSPLATPDVPASGTESVEMRNLRAAEARPSDSQPAAAEELPAPPPSLVAPQNSVDEERSIIAD